MTSLQILGPIEVWLGEQRLARGGPRQLTPFAYLVLQANRAVSRDAIIDALRGPVCLYLGSLARSLGDADTAERHLLDATWAAIRAGAAIWEARATGQRGNWPRWRDELAVRGPSELSAKDCYRRGRRCPA